MIAAFQSEMRNGLDGDRGSIAMNPSFVSRPSGAESGRFVTLDLGGTNVRATVVEISRGALNVLKHDSFRLASATGTASDLFDPMARFLGEVLEDDGEYSLGFIFAFPMNQTGIRSGSLSKWTKELNFDGVEGNDAVALLERAVADAAGAFPVLTRLTVGALANDTVGVLAAGAYLDPRCDMGLIVGTGANMAVTVPTHMTGGHLPPAPGRPGEMVINMECGNFDGVRSIQTTYDRRLDAESGIPTVSSWRRWSPDATSAKSSGSPCWILRPRVEDSGVGSMAPVSSALPTPSLPSTCRTLPLTIRKT